MTALLQRLAWAAMAAFLRVLNLLERWIAK